MPPSSTTPNDAPTSSAKRLSDRPSRDQPQNAGYVVIPATLAGAAALPGRSPGPFSPGRSFRWCHMPVRVRLANTESGASTSRPLLSRFACGWPVNSRDAVEKCLQRFHVCRGSTRRSAPSAVSAGALGRAALAQVQIFTPWAAPAARDAIGQTRRVGEKFNDGWGEAVERVATCLSSVRPAASPTGRWSCPQRTRVTAGFPDSVASMR
jgi:hypothetical protein